MSTKDDSVNKDGDASSNGSVDQSKNNKSESRSPRHHRHKRTTRASESYSKSPGGRSRRSHHHSKDRKESKTSLSLSPKPSHKRSSSRSDRKSSSLSPKPASRKSTKHGGGVVAGGLAIGVPATSEKDGKERRRERSSRPGAESVTGGEESGGTRSRKEREKHRESAKPGVQAVSGRASRRERQKQDKESSSSTSRHGAESVTGHHERSSIERRKNRSSSRNRSSSSIKPGAESLSGSERNSKESRKNRSSSSKPGAESLSGSERNSKERRKHGAESALDSSARSSKERRKQERASKKLSTTVGSPSGGENLAVAMTIEESRELVVPNEEATALRHENEELAARVNDLETRLQNKDGNNEEEEARRKKKKRCSIMIGVIVVCLGIAGAVAAVLLTRTSATETQIEEEDQPADSPVDSSPAPSLLEGTLSLAPSLGPSQVPSSSPTFFFYRIPSEEQCAKILNQDPVDGQNELPLKQFALDLDLALVDPGIDPEIWKTSLSETLQANLVPELSCCEKSGTLFRITDGLEQLQTGNRCMIANANATATYDENIPCDTENDACVRSPVILSIVAKTDERRSYEDSDIANVIRSVVGLLEQNRKLQATNFGEKYGLSSDIFSDTVAVRVRNLVPTTAPSVAPTMIPSQEPSMVPSRIPSIAPSRGPSIQPVVGSTPEPTVVASFPPSLTPSVSPSKRPSFQPVVGSTPRPSVAASFAPSLTPSVGPSKTPSTKPSITPSSSPSLGPSMAPSTVPSKMLSASPSQNPSALPSMLPSQEPSLAPSEAPSSNPSLNPSAQPSLRPSFAPSKTPTDQPSKRPTMSPSIGYFGPVTKYKEQRMSSSGNNILIYVDAPPASVISGNEEVDFTLTYYGDIDASNEAFDVQIAGTSEAEVGYCNAKPVGTCSHHTANTNCPGTLNPCGSGGASCKSGWTFQSVSFSMTATDFNSARDAPNDRILVSWMNVLGQVSRTWNRDCLQWATVTIQYAATREN